MDYAKWFFARLRLLDAHIKDREFLCDNRFTIADIAVGYALYLAEVMKLSEFTGREFTPQVADYLARLKQRPAFVRADAMDGGLSSPFSN
jgi:glutathione S-transferase